MPKLVKSQYSLQVNIPADIVKAFGWKQGDFVLFTPTRNQEAVVSRIQK